MPLALGHVAIEFRLILGPAQFAHECLELLNLGIERGALLVELASFLFEARQLSGAVLVESDVPRRAGNSLAAQPVGGAPDIAADLGGHVLQPIAPENVGEHRQAERPEHDEAKNHQRDRQRIPTWADGAARHSAFPSSTDILVKAAAQSAGGNAGLA